jgi:regulator of sigma E protease
VTTPVVGEVVALSPAERAGLRAGDRIDSIDGTPITRFEDVVSAVMSRPGRTVAIQITRQGLSQMVQATIEQRQAGSRVTGVLGVKGGTVAYERMNPLAAMPAGIAQTWDVGVQTLDGVWGMISGARGTDDLGGPVRIAQLSSQVAKLGIASLVGFIAVLSVNLGLINLFPIPVLDGGHLTFYAFEALRGRPLPPKAVEVCFRVGLALLVALFVFATWNDLSHLGLFRWVASILA